MGAIVPYTIVDDYTLSVIKAPPLTPISVTWVADATLDDNRNLRGHVFQFTYRYIYPDGEKSVWALPTDVYPPILREDFNIYERVLTNVAPPVVMRLRLYIIPTNVFKMELAVRADGGAWYYYDEITITSVMETTHYADYNFANNKVLIQLPDGEVIIPYDYVPRYARSQEIINKNIICYGDLLEGYTNPRKIDVTFDSKIVPMDEFHPYLAQNLPLVTSTTTSTTSTTPAGDYSPYNMENVITHARIIERPGNVIDIEWPALGGVQANFVIYLIANGHYHIAVCYGVLNWDYTAAVLFANIIMDDPWIADCWTPGAGTTLRITFNPELEDIGAIGLKYSNFDVIPSVKDYAKYYFGVEYIDKFGRVGTIMEDESMMIEVPSLNSYGISYNDYITKVNYSINHTPPLWAERWRFCYGSNISWWMQYLVRPYHDIDRSVYKDEERMMLKIKINQGVNDVRDHLKDYALNNYVWEEGDRIRIIGTIPIREDDVTHFPVDMIDTSFGGLGREIDYKIHSFDGIYIYIPDFTLDDQLFVPVPPLLTPDVDSPNAPDILVEIYRLKKDTENIVYKSLPEVYQVTNAGESSRTHGSPTGTIHLWNERICMMPMANLVSDREAIYVEPETTTTTSTSTTSPTSTITTWDYTVGFAAGLKCCVAHVPFFGHKLNIKFEDLWDSKVNISDPNAKEIRVNKLRWGGQYIDDATINNVCRFLYNDQIRMPDKYGFIYGMREVGYTLKVFQQSKDTSIYIGREETVNADGSVSYVYVSSLFGNIAPHIEEFGTIFPDSIVVSDRFVYFFDIYSGRIIRDAPNGIMDIGFGQFKMQSYFRGKADALLASGVSNVNVIGGVDRENNMVYFTFLDSVNSQNNETIGFHEPSGRWKSFYPFIPEHYGKLGENTFFSFRNGRPYVHNSDTPNRCTFYGVKYAQNIWLVSNINPQFNKQFNSISIVSNEPWMLPNNGDVYINPNTTFPNGMSSKLRTTDFEEYEGEFRAAFLGDLLTGGAVANDIYLYTGRELKGREILLKLTNSENGEVNLFIVRVNSSVSR